MYDKNVLDLINLDKAEWTFDDEEYMHTVVVVNSCSYKVYAEYQWEGNDLEFSIVDIEFIDNKPRH